MAKWISFVLLITVLTVGLLSCGNHRQSIHVSIESNSQQVQHGLQKLKELEKSGNYIFNEGKSDLSITGIIDTILGAEAYRIKTVNQVVHLSGGDEVGLMYGLQYIKEQLEQGKNKIAEIEETPHLSFRAIKFNLPWSTYRNGEALSQHYETCRDTIFWHSFLDMMVENRFNKLTLWNLHPFNYLVKTEKYPEACGFSDQEMAEWEQFWKALFRMAKDRGIETYLVNWNIFVSPEFARAHSVADYCLTNEYKSERGDTSEIIKDYTRESVKAVIDKYPDLTGLGITLGEGMGGMTPDERESWLLESYIEGMRRASRKVKFIHRVPLSAGLLLGGSTDPYTEKMTRQTLDTLTCVDGPINIELKFNWSHSHSTPHLVKVHGGKLTDAYWNPLPKNYYLAWMMRNEDFFVLRWGDPVFIREHLKFNVHPYVNGYYVGSECYIPAKDYITSLPNTSNVYAFERQWMFYKVWGRLLYNPDTPDEEFSDAFEMRFPGYGKQLFSAQSKVSRIPLIVASYWNASSDLTLYSEGLLGKDQKLISLIQLCEKQPMDPDYVSIKDYCAQSDKNFGGKLTPLILADSIDSFCKRAIEEVEEIAPKNNNNLLYEVSDIRTWAHLGMYFSNKLRSAVAYQKFQNEKNKKFLNEAKYFLEKAVGHWHEVVSITTPIYKPMPLQHYWQKKGKYFHWSIVEEEGAEELKWLKGLGIKE